ncbi:MAG: DUF86 domain-containing protein [Candidatus Liptonbacteria bacterium]|nr:DUF86 domain-containing protein [Candidatus Liptonbacteria bacterium]
MSKRGYRLYLVDIKTALENVEQYTAGLPMADFIGDQKTVDAVVRNLEIMGEAAANLTEDEREKYPAVPWGKIIGMRNKVIHEYFGVDTEILWQTIKEDLPKLKEEIEKIG